MHSPVQDLLLVYRLVFRCHQLPEDLEELKAHASLKANSVSRVVSILRPEASLFNSISEDLLANDGGSKDDNPGAYAQASV